MWALLLVAPSARARVYYVLDLDGTITNDQSRYAAWRTPWILFRVKQLRSLLQQDPDELGLPETLDISYGEYVRLRPSLAIRDGLLGDLNPVPLDADPIWTDRPKSFVPGYYYVDTTLSFKYYRPGRKDQNYLLRDQKLSEERHERFLDPKGPWGQSDGLWGEAFPLLQKGLSDPQTVEDVIVLTARHSLKRHSQQWIEHLQKRGFVRYAEGRSRNGRKTQPRFISMNDPQALAFGRTSLAQRKAAAMKELALELLESRDGEQHLELAIRGEEARRGRKQELHTLIVAEDAALNQAALRRSLENLSTEHDFQASVKFVLLNAGPDELIEASRWPWRWTVFDHGFGRPATKAEIKSWTEIGDNDCERALGKRAGARGRK